jgi:hypothetical protein
MANSFQSSNLVKAPFGDLGVKQHSGFSLLGYQTDDFHYSEKIYSWLPIIFLNHFFSGILFQYIQRMIAIQAVQIIGI